MVVYLGDILPNESSEGIGPRSVDVEISRHAPKWLGAADEPSCHDAALMVVVAGQPWLDACVLVLAVASWRVSIWVNQKLLWIFADTDDRSNIADEIVKYNPVAHLD
jgi:hypothetical protein